MQKELNFFKLFDTFIAESKSGKRSKSNGSRIKPGTVQHYILVKNELIKFSVASSFPIRLKSIVRVSGRTVKSEHAYWNRFYRKYADYLYGKGCFDNYVGAHFKVIRTFFIYLNRKKAIYTGEIHKEFYVRNESIPIVILEQHQLAFMREDIEFENTLPIYLQKTKDILIFGCYTGLRFSDLMQLKQKDLLQTPDATYLKVKSIKTSTETKIKLSDFTMQIITKYKRYKYLLPQLSNNRLNLNLKELCERAGWVHEVGKERECRGVVKKVTRDGKKYRFCDLITTHTMRRTAITNLLSMGMPETMVRKLSGHSANSKEFYRYVEYAQYSIDKEIDRINENVKATQKAA